MRPRHLRTLLGRLWRAQLRLKVMAGVVVVTLVALAAFDAAAVTTMRRYLLGQTDKNLQVALNLTRPQLPFLLASALVGNARRAHVSAVRGNVEQVSAPLRSLVGEFDISYVPAHGKQVALEIGANWIAGVKLDLPTNIAEVAVKPGPHTVVSPNGPTVMRLEGISVHGGSLVAGTSLDQVAKTINQVELIVTLGSVAVVLLIGLGVFVVLRRGLRPIEAMAVQADRITAGDLTDRVTPHNVRSEVGRLGAALNGMLARIETSVQEREASQEQIRRFFADASHELRTPLASLRANAELYQQGAVARPAEVDEVMRRITIETQRMGRLVDDMLGLARLGQHPRQCREPVNLTALVQACAERAWIADPARTWRVRVAGGLEVVGDEELLRRAVDNLLTNVLVHTPDDTIGTVTASGADGSVTIEVSDQGPGVPPGKLPRIFERFYRAGGPPARSARPGSGLGLAIAAEIAAAHGGTAAAAPAVPHGLRVTLTLPAHPAQARRPAAELAAAVN
jgi:two-component system, OmpR family, sensor kinase